MESIMTKKITTDEMFGTFLIGETEVAVNVLSIQEVVNFPEKVIAVPLAPPFLEGVFNLRGSIIPILNLKSILNISGEEIERHLKKIAILECQGAKVGFLFDQTNEIIRTDSEMVDHFNYEKSSSHKIIDGAIKFPDGNRIIQILSPDLLIQIENIPQVLSKIQQSEINKKKLVTVENRKKCISFKVNGILMGIEMSGIHEIIKVDKILDSSVKEDICLGIINLRGSTIPIVDTSLMLGAGQTTIDSVGEKRIVILKIDQEKFGLLVDEVIDINTFMNNEVMAMPVFNKKRANMFLGCIAVEGVGEVILLEQSKIFTNQEIIAITQGHSKIYSSADERENVCKKRFNRESYISFRLEYLMAVSIKEVREIINYSDEIMTTPGSPKLVSGILNLRGNLVTVVDMRTLYSMPDKEGSSAGKILIFEQDQERIGLVVDNVESIIVVDSESKMNVPGLLTVNAKERFGDDISEIITVKREGKPDGALVVLNISNVISKIVGSVSAA